MTSDFFRARLDQMIDLHLPLVVLGQRMPWAQIEAALALNFAHGGRNGQAFEDCDLFGPRPAQAGAWVSNAGRLRPPIRLMTSLLYPKHAYNLSDEAVIERWSENVVWQYFSDQEYYEPKPPCDVTQLGAIPHRHRRSWSGRTDEGDDRHGGGDEGGQAGGVRADDR